jgi:hypothetical protein
MMTPVLAFAVRGVAFALGAMLLWSGGAKTLAPRTLRATIEALGIRDPFGVPAACAVTALEIALGGLLVSGTVLRAALLGVVALCSAFAVVSLVAERRSLRIPCACFGLAETRLGRATLRRASALVLVAAAAAAVAPAAGGDDTLDGVTGALGAALGFGMAGWRARQRRRIVPTGVLRVLPPGSRAPAITGRWLDDGSAAARRDFAGRDSTLLFLDPRCPVCRSVADGVAALGIASLYAVVAGEAGEARAFAESTALAPERIVLDERYRTAKRYRLNGMPAIVAVRGGCVAGAAFVREAADARRVAAIHGHAANGA